MVWSSTISRNAAPAALWGYPVTATATPPVKSALNASLEESIWQTALVRRRFGYRRIHDMLRK